MKKFSRVLSLLLALSFAGQVFAQTDSLITTSRKVDNTLTPGTIFHSGNYPGAVLMRINLLGEVQRPGVHHVPVETDFTTVLGFAGGPTRFADASQAVIKRKGPKGEEVIPVDINKYFSEVHKQDFTLKPNDTLYIPTKEQAISDNTFRTVMVVSTIVGIVLSAVLIHNTTDGSN